MAPVTISLTIPEADVARTKLAAEQFTGLGPTASAKELLAATVKQMVVSQERQQATFTQPGIT